MILVRVRRSFRLEAKRCEKGSEKNFASKRNKGHKAKNSETKQIKEKNPDRIKKNPDRIKE
jgi:hypothetical protein